MTQKFGSFYEFVSDEEYDNWGNKIVRSKEEIIEKAFDNIFDRLDDIERSLERLEERIDNVSGAYR